MMLSCFLCIHESLIVLLFQHFQLWQEWSKTLNQNQRNYKAERTNSQTDEEIHKVTLCALYVLCGVLDCSALRWMMFHFSRLLFELTKVSTDTVFFSPCCDFLG